MSSFELQTTAHQISFHMPDQTDLPPSIPLTKAQRDLVKGSAPVLAQHGGTITRLFYSNMFKAHPDLLNMFSHSKKVTGHQAEALAGAVVAYAQNIDDIEVLLPVVDRISQKHAALGVKAPHYGVVAKYLMEAITEVLGADIFKGELYAAWGAAYWQLAHLFIDQEAVLYAQAGWVGWKKFSVKKRVQESSDIVSFYLVPLEDAPKMDKYRPGQYISVRKFIKELGLYQSRHYSLSDAPSLDHYRISIKRDMGVQATQVKGSGEAIVDTTQAAHPGWMSNLFHDTLQEGHEIEVAYPFGDFVLDAGSGPVVLIAAGVGATPLLAMLNAILSDAASMNRKVSWIQAAKTPLALPFRKIISDLAAKHGDRLRVSLHYTNPLGAPQGEVFTSGRIDAEQLDTRLLHLDDETAQYYTCGPDVFMRDMAKQLRSRGVDHRRIHAELFTSGELLV